MPEDLSRAMSLETTPEPEPEVAVSTEHEPVDDDAEPEGVVEVTPGRRMVDVSVLAAERKRVREATAHQIREKELTPLQQKAQEADALREALNAARPYVDLVKQHPELLQTPAPQPAEAAISDDEAAQEARDLQLFDATSQLDVKTAKKIIARRRAEVMATAQQAAQQAIAPYAQSSAEQASRQNFAQMAQLTGSDGQPLVDPRILAEEWVQLPVELTQNPQVAEVVLERAIGKSLRQGKSRQAVLRSPVFSEASGGRQAGGPVVLTPLDRKLGLTEKDLKESAKGFVAGGVSVICE